MRQYYYRDINEDNPKTSPDLYDVDSITQNIVNLIRTTKGTRPFNIEYGVDIEDELFELMDTGAELRIYNTIADGLRQFEPRVELDQGASDVVADPDNNQFDIKLYFSIEGFDDKLYQVTESIQQR